MVTLEDDQILTLVGIARTHADVADITSFDDVVQGLHGLFNGSVIVKSMT